VFKGHMPSPITQSPIFFPLPISHLSLNLSHGPLDFSLRLTYSFLDVPMNLALSPQHFPAVIKFDVIYIYGVQCRSYDIHGEGLHLSEGL